MMQPPPPRPDVPPPEPSPPAAASEVRSRRSIPAGGVVGVIAGIIAIVSPLLAWWRASIRIALGGEVSTRILGDVRGNDTWFGPAAVVLGLILVAAAIAALTATSARARRFLGLAMMVAGASTTLLGVSGLFAGDDLVAARVKESVSRGSQGRVETVGQLEQRLGSEASAEPQAKPLAGVVVVLFAGVGAIAGGWLLAIEPGGKPARTPGSLPSASP